MSRKVGVIIAAGGSSQRMKGINKIFAPICGVPVIAKTCLAFQVNENITEIVVSTKEEYKEYITALLNEFGITKLKAVVTGGDTRYQSVKNAVGLLLECDYVAVHDGARPLVSQKLINECVDAAFEYGFAVPVLESTDTLKTVDTRIVTGTVDRSKVFRVQTPQIFRRDAFFDAYNSLEDFAATDDCALIEALGYKVNTCAGAEENIKITHQSDIAYAEFLLKGGSSMVRVGHGYDVHKLIEGRKLILCGVDIPNNKGLLGHSDADVALHAVMDSLLGAAALGDIGKLFPDNNPKYLGADSKKLLREVALIVNNDGYTIGNIDVTIVAQSPKLAPYNEQMVNNIAEACGISTSSVSVKATTEEGLGFTGSGEAISAFAVCTILS